MIDTSFPLPSAAEDGPLELRNAAGLVILRGNRRAGQLEGEVLIYDDDGRLTQSATYREGQLHGPLRIFENGRCRMESLYAFGRLDGPLRLFDAAGTLTAEIPHQGGLRHGTARFFDGEGELVRQAGFAAGQPHGECLDFGPNGKPLERSVFSDGLRDGEVQSFHPEGGLRRRQLFRAGKAAGPAAWFDGAGRPMPDPTEARRSWWSRLWGRGKTEDV